MSVPGVPGACGFKGVMGEEAGEVDGPNQGGSSLQVIMGVLKIRRPKTQIC